VGGEFQYTRGFYLERRDTKCWKILDNFNDLIVFVEIDQVEWEEHAEGMNPAGGHDPKTLTRAQAEPADETLETRERGVCDGHAQVEKAFAGQVVYAVCRSFHKLSFVPGGYPATGHALRISIPISGSLAG
jgi:hypothetical protein